jgi:poly-beta-hydroxyalkanoate depolymerase
MLPTVPVEDYSCGFWAAEIMLQLCFDKVSLANGVNVTFDLDEYRKYLYHLVQTRFLGIDGALRRKSQPQVQVIASVSVESVSVVAAD